MPGGIVHIVGAGPGAPDLITLRGLRLLAQADVVVYDRLVDERLLGAARPGARLVYAGKAPGGHGMRQEEINELLADYAGRGLRVVRLKGGDPLTYGRGEEECLHLVRAGVPCRIVPGVPSYTAAAAEALAPLGARGYSRVFAVATGTLEGDRPLPAGRLRRVLEAADTLALLMAARRSSAVLGVVSETLGPDAPVAIVESATTPGSRVRIGTAASLAGARVEPPAVILVGGGVAWRLENLGAGPYY